METRTYNVYTYDELSDESKEKALENWRTNNDYYFLSEQLEDFLKELLKENKIKEEGETKLYYSLSYCQGDGTCFIGKFKWKNYYVSISHNSHYYHEYSTFISIETMNGNEAKESVYEEFKNMYYDICQKIEKEGYSIIEYEDSEESIKNIFEANEYMFTENGEIA